MINSEGRTRKVLNFARQGVESIRREIDVKGPHAKGERI
jgi:hypothetical protein